MGQVNPERMFDVTFEEATDAICAYGPDITILLEGHMGIGKSAQLEEVGRRFPTYKKYYFDCTTKMDAGDVMIPKLKELDGNDFVRFATNEELGIHLQKTPSILMIDEYGKGNKSLTNSMNRLCYERKLGAYTMHKDSIVFLTTNLGAENVGDTLAPQQLNRMTVMRVRKPSHMDWIDWGLKKGLNHVVLGCVRENPHWLQPFDEVDNPSDNPYIYHPREQRRHFVTGRSLEKASIIFGRKDMITTRALTCMLNGTIGVAATNTLMTFSRLTEQLPTMDSIKNDPMNAKVPDDAAGVCLVIYRTLQTIERDWVDSWMTYVQRLGKEAQGMFGKTVCHKDYGRRKQVVNTTSFMTWARANNYMYEEDQS